MRTRTLKRTVQKQVKTKSMVQEITDYLVIYGLNMADLESDSSTTIYGDWGSINDFIPFAKGIQDIMVKHKYAKKSDYLKFSLRIQKTPSIRSSSGYGGIPPSFKIMLTVRFVPSDRILISFSYKTKCELIK